MKYLSLVTLRTVVALGLSLSCANAQLSKEEVSLLFKDLDVTKVHQIFVVKDIYEEDEFLGKKKYKQKSHYDSIYERAKLGPLKIELHENSLMFSWTTIKLLYPYQHIKRLTHQKGEIQTISIIL